MCNEMQPRAVRDRIFGDRHAVPGERACEQWRQSRHQPQQARFAAAVGPGEQQRAPGCEREIEALEHQPLAAPTGEAAAFEQTCGRWRGFRQEERSRIDAGEASGWMMHRWLSCRTKEPTA